MWCSHVWKIFVRWTKADCHSNWDDKSTILCRFCWFLAIICFYLHYVCFRLWNVSCNWLISNWFFIQLFFYFVVVFSVALSSVATEWMHFELPLSDYFFLIMRNKNYFRKWLASCVKFIFNIDNFVVVFSCVMHSTTSRNGWKTSVDGRLQLPMNLTTFASLQKWELKWTCGRNCGSTLKCLHWQFKNGKRHISRKLVFSFNFNYYDFTCLFFFALHCSYMNKFLCKLLVFIHGIFS